jgi:sulfane dehydrogenase subunit SoxC
MPWVWDGGPVRLQSRATDEHGDNQRTRESWYAQYRPTQIYHYNAIQTWQVNESGEVSNVYV